MASWRNIRVRKWLALAALLGALLHVGLVPWHAVMQIAAAAPVQLSSAEQWAAQLDVPICHRLGAPAKNADGSQKPVTPPKSPSQCVVCASVLAAVAVSSDALVAFAPGYFDQSYIDDVTTGAALPRASAFEARGPPRFA